MEELLTSTNPALAFAAVSFVTGGFFDLIFSDEFKQKVRSLVTGPGKGPPLTLAQLQGFAAHLVNELLLPSRPLHFAIKALSLSALFYVLSATYQVLSHPDVEEAHSIQIVILQRLITFDLATWAFFLIQIINDILCVYVTLMFLSIIALLKEPGKIALTLLSNLAVVALVWSIAYGISVSLHVAILDHRPRAANVGIDLLPFEVPEEDRLRWMPPFNLQAEISYHPQQADCFIHWDDKAFILRSNISDRPSLAQKLFDVAPLLQVTFQATGQKMQSNDGVFFQEFVIRGPLELADFITMAMSGVDWSSVTTKLANRQYYSYASTTDWYFGIIDDPRREVERVGRSSILVYCDGRLRMETGSEKLDGETTAACKEYIVVPAVFFDYLALVAGASTVEIRTISSDAFFWASIALMATFYALLVLIIAGRSLRVFMAKLFAARTFREEATFTAISAIPIGLSLLAGAVWWLIQHIVT